MKTYATHNRRPVLTNRQIVGRLALVWLLFAFGVFGCAFKASAHTNLPPPYELYTKDGKFCAMATITGTVVTATQPRSWKSTVYDDAWKVVEQGKTLTNGWSPAK